MADSQDVSPPGARAPLEAPLEVPAPTSNLSPEPLTEQQRQWLREICVSAALTANEIETLQVLAQCLLHWEAAQAVRLKRAETSLGIAERSIQQERAQSMRVESDLRGALLPLQNLARAAEDVCQQQEIPQVEGAQCLSLSMQVHRLSERLTDTRRELECRDRQVKRLSERLEDQRAQTEISDLRDRFAQAALAGLVAGAAGKRCSELANEAYAIARFCLEERGRCRAPPLAADSHGC